MQCSNFSSQLQWPIVQFALIPGYKINCVNITNRRTDGWMDSDYLVCSAEHRERTNKLQVQLQLQQCGNIINYATNVQIKHKIPKHLKCSNNQCAHCAQLFEDMYGAGAWGAWQAVAVFLATDNQNCLNI